MKRLFGALLAGFVIWTASGWLISDDEAKIQGVLQAITAGGSFEGEIHPFEQLAYARGLAKHVSENVRLSILDEEGLRVAISGRRELEEKLLLLRKFLDQLAVHSSNLDITQKGGVAEVKFKGRAMGREPGREDYFLEEHRILAIFEEINGEWLITSAQNLDPIESVYSKEQ